MLKGTDVFDYLRADVTITGTTPKIPRGAKIKVEDYTQQFSRAGHGLISSRSEHKYEVEGTNKVVPFTVEQTIRWEECSGSEGLVLRRRNTAKLMSSRNFIIYNKADEIVRYAMTSNISTLTGSEDPCRDVDCGEGGLCLVVGSSHTCTCLTGFTPHHTTGLCQDIDECEAGLDDCDPLASCNNTPGSFSCSCPPGYVGEGRQCLEERSCADLSCSEAADCVTDSGGQGRCVCRRGYTGDGHSCTIVPSDCEYHQSVSVGSPLNLQ